MQIVVEAGFTVGPNTLGTYLHWDDPTRGLWDTDVWAPDDLWTDITSSLIALEIDQASTRSEGPLLRYEPTSARIRLRSENGEFDPLNATGPYTSGGVSQVDPMRPVRVRAGHNDTWYTLCTLYADSWQQTYPGPTRGECLLTASDGQKIIRRYPRGDGGAAAGGGELAGARVNRILDGIGWPAGDRVIAAGQTTLQATTLAGDAWDELLLVQDTEPGQIYIDELGRVVFRDRYSLLQDTRSANSQVTFGQQMGGSEVMFVQVPRADDDTRLVNYVSATRVGGTAQITSDSASITRYGTLGFDRADLLMETDSTALNYAQWILSMSKDGEPRFAQVILDPRINEDLIWPQVLGRQVGDRVTVTSRQLTPTVTWDGFIRGRHHKYEPGRRWQSVLDLEPSSKAAFLVWDSAGSGFWDTDAWVY